MVRPLRFSPLPRLSSLIKYNAALGLLQDVRQPLIALYHPSPPDATGLAPLDLLGLPLPQNSISDLHLNLVSTYFLHVMQVLSHTVTDVSAFAAALHHPATPTLLAWTSTMSALPEAQHDQPFTRAYSIISRLASSSVPASSAYSLQIY